MLGWRRFVLILNSAAALFVSGKLLSLEHFPYYCELDEFYECRFYWGKTAYKSLLLVCTYRENALVLTFHLEVLHG